METELSMNEATIGTLTDVTGCKVDCEDGGLRPRISTIGDAEKIDWGTDKAETLVGPIDGGDSGEGSVEFDRAADGRTAGRETLESSEIVEIVDFGVYAGKAGSYEVFGRMDGSE